MHAWETAEGETNAFAAPGRSGAMVIPRDVLELRHVKILGGGGGGGQPLAFRPQLLHVT